jgi:hypothetical protein
VAESVAEIQFDMFGRQIEFQHVLDLISIRHSLRLDSSHL